MKRKTSRSTAPASGNRSNPRRPQRVRIIAGRWRGRWLNVPDIDGLRPTGDRTRETLFSWLQPRLADTCCLDLFAGSGALGIEALSRGAAEVHLFEKDKAAANNLRQQLETLGADDAACLHHVDVLKFLESGSDSSKSCLLYTSDAADE